MLKEKLNNSKYSFFYNEEDDILDVLSSTKSSYSEEILPGIYKNLSIDNDRMIGMTILDFRKRSIHELSSKIPYKINFTEVHRKIRKISL